MTGAWAPFPGAWGRPDPEPAASPALLAQLVDANARWASGRSLAGVPRAPARGLVVITCMDGRLDPLSQLGLAPGDAHILRNAGARVTDDVLRSLELSHTLGKTSDVVLLGHTDCLANGSEDATLGHLRDGARRLAETPLRVHALRFDTASGLVNPVAEAGPGR